MTQQEASARRNRLIERWFPVGAVDDACGTPAGSGQNEKAIFTWFASRPIAQARAAVLCSMLEEDSDEDSNAALRALVERSIRRGDLRDLEELSRRIHSTRSTEPVVVDCFSGRGIIPLEAARLGIRTVGIDLSPVAVLASRLLADWAMRDWSSEPDAPFDALPANEGVLESDAGEPKLVRDVRRTLAEVGRRAERELAPHFPKNEQGAYPWGYLWAVSIPCDSCRRRFPLVGSLVLRQPYSMTGDPGQAFRLKIDVDNDAWSVDIHDGVPTGEPTLATPVGSRGKVGRCPFCQHMHPLEALKAKGIAGQYEDVPLVAGDLDKVTVTDNRGRTRTVERKTFRPLTDAERTAAVNINLDELPPFGCLPAAPTEQIPAGNRDSVRGTGYGYSTFASLMNARQVLSFIATARAIREVHTDLLAAGASSDYAAALASYASANLVRRLRAATRGARLQAVGKPAGAEQNRNKIGDLFINESAVGSNFDWFETGPGDGPGTWTSRAQTGITPLLKHVLGLPVTGRPGRFRQGTATALPYRTASVDAVVCDPPYYSMIDYADVSDLFFVWLRRCLADIVPDLFGTSTSPPHVQDKAHEIIVKRSPESGDHRTATWYEEQLAAAFAEMKRVLKRDGVLTIVFGHSDPAAWRRLLGALRDAGFVVTSAWPARTESGNTGVASIKVTVTIGCRVASDGRTSATASQVEREIVELVRKRVAKWDEWGLALSDQLMAAYGPAMQIVGQYRSIQRPDGTEPDLDHFLNIGRRAVAEAHTFKVDELPLDTFDPATRFAIFWLRAFGRGTVNKGEAVFHAQSSQMRIDALRPHILEETKGGFTITFVPPASVSDRSSTFEVARAVAAGWTTAATEGAADAIVASGRNPDDAHLWATTAELVRQLPESDKVAMALTACQRNRRAIETAARHGAAAVAQSEPDALPFDTPGDHE